MKLDEAITQQISSYLEEPEVKTEENSEMTSLLKAFIYLIQAYLSRVGEKKFPSRVSDTFGSNG